MTGPAPSARTLSMVEAYEAGHTLREVAEQFDVSYQAVHQALQRNAPSIMRPQTETRFPSVGKPGHELYRQGKCKVCEVPLFGYRPESRKLCGHCEGLLL